jgi:sensor histidine kinase regulating citrate/malate metabolism
MTLHHKNHASIIARVQHPVLAALLVAQMSAARQRGVEVQLSRRTRVPENSPAMRNTEAVSIVTGLLEHAIEAASAVHGQRRRVALTLNETDRHLGIVVRHWGETHSSAAGPDETIYPARGSVKIERLATGTRVRVSLALD